MGKIKKASLIREHMLEKEYRDSLRKKSEKITLDDLSSDIVTTLTNNKPGGNAYNDTALRERIAKLENGKVTTGEVFVKNVDKITRDNLDGRSKQIYDYAAEVPSLKNIKADKDYVDNNFRKTSKAITEADFDSEYNAKVNNVIAQMNNIKSAYTNNASLISSINTNKTNISNLQSSKAEKTELNSYRNKNSQITLNDLEGTVRDAINKIAQLKQVVDKAATATSISNTYRKKIDKIVESDLDAALQSKIQKSSLAGENVESEAQQVVDNNMSTIHNWVFNALGSPANNTPAGGPEDSDKLHHITPYQFAHDACAFAGTLSSGGQLTFSSICSFLYSRLVSLEEKENKNNSSITSLQNKLNNLQISVNTLINALNSLKNTVSNIDTRLSSLENKAATKGW